MYEVRSAMVRRVPGWLAVCLAVCAACVGGASTGYPAPDGPRYAVDATVIDGTDGGPVLCTLVQPSLPPSCGGIPIRNWRWRDVKGEETVAGVTSGRYRLVGAYDGDSFFLTERPGPPTPPPPPPEAFKFSIPCAAPEGGWRNVDPAAATEAARVQVGVSASQAPDYAGLWRVDTAGVVVLTAAFTGDLARHEAELRAHWGGGLCVVRHPYSLRQLRDIQADLSSGDPVRAFGLRPVTIGVDEARNRVELTAVVVEDDTRRAIDARYGPSAVVATSLLRRVS